MRLGQIGSFLSRLDNIVHRLGFIYLGQQQGNCKSQTYPSNGKVANIPSMTGKPGMLYQSRKSKNGCIIDSIKLIKGDIDFLVIFRQSKNVWDFVFYLREMI